MALSKRDVFNQCTQIMKTSYAKNLNNGTESYCKHNCGSAIEQKNTQNFL